MSELKRDKIPELDKIPEEFFENDDWYTKNFSWHLHTVFAQTISTVYLLNKRFDFGYKWAGTFTGKQADWFYDVDDLQRVRGMVLDRVYKSTIFTEEIKNEYFAHWDNYVKTEDKLGQVDLKSLDNHSLYEWYENLFWAMANSASYGYITDCFLSSGTEDWLASLITDELDDNVKKEKVSEIIEKLTAPVHHSFINREYLDLLAIGLEIEKNTDLKKIFINLDSSEVVGELGKFEHVQMMFQAHRDNYHWIENNYWVANDFPVKYFIEKIKKLFEQNLDLQKEYNRIKTEPKQNKETKQEIYSEYKISKKLQNVIYASEVFTHIQDTRKQGVLRHGHFLIKFCEELASRFDLTKEQALVTVEPELEDILINENINVDELNARLKKCFVYYSPKGYKIISGDEAEEINRTDFLPELEGVKEIKGVSASKGRATGKVRIVLNNEAIKQFKKGEILVSNNTTPEYVPAMKKAVAIITEQGGITTHAAIVSRELGIPCVIGTKIATRVLKDGDMVEVNAEKGVVRRV